MSSSSQATFKWKSKERQFQCDDQSPISTLVNYFHSSTKARAKKSSSNPLDISQGLTKKKLSGSDELWVPFGFGKDFCDYLGFETALKPLLDYGNGFITCHLDTDIVMIRRADFLINATHIYKVAKESQRCMQLKTQVTINEGPLEYQGKYCFVPERLQWCQSHRQISLMACLRRILNDYGYKQHLRAAVDSALEG